MAKNIKIPYEKYFKGRSCTQFIGVFAADFWLGDDYEYWGPKINSAVSEFCILIAVMQM